MAEWMDRVLKMPVRHLMPIDDTEVIAAQDLKLNDVFDFAGATLRATTITHFGPMVEVEAVGPFGQTTLHYLKHEALQVFLPRAEVWG